MKTTRQKQRSEKARLDSIAALERELKRETDRDERANIRRTLKELRENKLDVAFGPGWAAREEQAWTREQKIVIEKLAAVVLTRTLNALGLPPRVRLKILADCAERISVQSRTKAQRVELRKAAGRVAHGVVG